MKSNSINKAWVFTFSILWLKVSLYNETFMKTTLHTRVVYLFCNVQNIKKKLMCMVLKSVLSAYVKKSVFEVEEKLRGQRKTLICCYIHYIDSLCTSSSRSASIFYYRKIIKMSAFANFMHMNRYLYFYVLASSTYLFQYVHLSYIQ